MTEDREADFPRIAEWMRSEAAAKSLDEIRDYVFERNDEFRATALAFPEAALQSSSPTLDWEPLDVVRHLAGWDSQIGEDILHVALTGERPGNPVPQLDGGRDELLAKLQESVDSVWAHVSAANPEDFLDVTWPHPFFGELNWREWFLFLGVHAIDHTGQLRQMREALGA